MKMGIWKRYLFKRNRSQVYKVTKPFYSKGAVLSAGWVVSISERFVFNSNVSQTFEAVFQVGPSDVEPTDRYPGRIIFFNAQSRIELGIRYTL
jgi:hypothetical protein|tara:strand:- start:368 stop:646 length:279 start_codon:yes stop_codon:yes gene_type:complete